MGCLECVGRSVVACGEQLRDVDMRKVIEKMVKQHNGWGMREDGKGRDEKGVRYGKEWKRRDRW